MLEIWQIEGKGNTTCVDAWVHLSRPLMPLSVRLPGRNAYVNDSGRLFITMQAGIQCREQRKGIFHMPHPCLLLCLYCCNQFHYSDTIIPTVVMHSEARCLLWRQSTNTEVSHLAYPCKFYLSNSWSCSAPAANQYSCSTGQPAAD